MAAAKLVVEDMFETAHRIFFSTCKANLSDALPAARETVFAKEVPPDCGSTVAVKKDAEVLAHA